MRKTLMANRIVPVNKAAWLLWPAALAGLFLCSEARSAQSDWAVSPAPANTNFAVKALGDGTFLLGNVRLDKTRKEISFAAQINQTEGLAEYLLVAAHGKLHESILVTDATPVQIQTALLLLGAKGSPTNRLPEDSTVTLPGDKVTIAVTWSNQTQRIERAGEDLVQNLKSKAVLSRGPWIYTGSFVYQGVFVAQDSGSIISLITDAEAIINNPRPGRESDDIWQPATRNLPPRDTPVTVSVRLLR